MEKDYLPRQLLSQEVPSLPQKVATDAQGRFRITGIGRERMVAVTIEGPTIVTQQARIFTRLGPTLEVPEFKANLENIKANCVTYYGANFQHAAAPTKPIIGVVRDKDTKKPLAGVTIQSVKLANDPIHGRDFIRTTTDAEGRYRLTGMPKGKGNKIMAVPADDQPYPMAGKEVADSLGLEPVTVDFELKRGVWVHGRITDKTTGKALPARVNYYALSDNPHLDDYPGFEDVFVWWSRLARKDGSFRVLALPGPGVLVVASSTNYLVANARDDAEGTKEYSLATSPHVIHAINYHAIARIDPSKEAGSVKRDVALDPGQTFTGTVLGTDGKPLAGAQTYGLSGQGGWRVSPLKSAEFTIRAFNPRHPRPILFQHREKQLTGILEFPKDGADSVTVRLQRGASVIGRLVNEDGQPRAGVELELWFRPTKASSWASYSPNRIKTDQAGRFHIVALLPGYHFYLSDAKGYFYFGGLRSGETKDLGDVRTKPDRE